MPDALAAGHIVQMCDKQLQQFNVQEMPLPSDQIEPLLYTTPMPLHSDVRAEMAAVWVKAGMMGQAMSEYESLGRWERLVDCYMFCGKAAAAESVLSERLKVDGENPQLLCAMGKLLRQDEWFERAWQASKCTHAGRCVVHELQHRSFLAKHMHAENDARAQNPAMQPILHMISSVYKLKQNSTLTHGPGQEHSPDLNHTCTAQQQL